ncbi:hypothetical protein ISN45_Aa05g005420 [Arabidopsis thaliana x Arabidopsis arenosa]|uniref:Uncharacterized protein n=1 Tax=Arabidopsis thaliana x Arabidopsis arenosa TaxID=1240361 RepID=A0A8T1ZJL3_9BRAS|nr:hypothetical protein ISN45_Aa05g005420 [Arabidopsis thaliana x Arabidopsis arenosa]
MAPNIYCCGAGTTADTEAVTGIFFLTSVWQILFSWLRTYQDLIDLMCRSTELDALVFFVLVSLSRYGQSIKGCKRMAKFPACTPSNTPDWCVVSGALRARVKHFLLNSDCLQLVEAINSTALLAEVHRVLSDVFFSILNFSTSSFLSQIS